MTKIGKTWWGRRFIEVLETFTEAGRLARGRQYLGGHRVIQWQVQGRRVEARIRGRVNPYYGIYEEPVYQTRIDFSPVPEPAWQEAIRQIGQRAGFVSRLLFSEMPDEIETFLTDSGVGLLPQSRQDIESGCSCPDSENPCKHVAGLFYLLAARLDQDPFLLFELRGLSRAELANRLKSTPLGAALASALTEDTAETNPVESYYTRPRALKLPVTMSHRDFWRGGKRLPGSVDSPQPAAVPGILVRKGGDYPEFWNKDESFVDVMAAFYEQVRKKSKDWI